MSDVQLDEARRLHRAGEFEKAAKLYEAVIRGNPRNLEAWQRLGFLHGQCGRWDDAQFFFGKAIQLNPDSPDAHFLRGTALQHLMRLVDAVVCFDAAVALRPNFAEALLNRAAALYRLRRYNEAGDDYDRLLAIDPHFPFTRGNRLFCRLQCCDWRSFEEENIAIMAGLRAGQRVVAPFDAKALSCTPEDELNCARIWSHDQYQKTASPLWSGERYDHGKIRVAYLSADYRDGPIATLLTGVLEHHDRTKFECIGIALSASDGSPARARFERSFSRFIDASALSDIEVALQLRGMEIDIAVDLNGLTEGCRPQIYAHRPAPILVNYLGFPGTVGTGFHDYIVADRTVIPDTAQRYYSESVVYLPDSFLPRDAAVDVAVSTASRVSAGLPVEGFVFASFNNGYKITPAMFAIWMRLLRNVPQSVLWLTQLNSLATENLKREATGRGIENHRLIFAPYLPAAADHLARLRFADLVLDTLPYNAHTTASDALWAGVPVVTCVGSTFAGRVAASLLQTIGLPELVTLSLEDYEALALKLALAPAALLELRSKVNERRKSSPLFKTERFTRHLERAFIEMHRRSQSGLKPESFAVSPYAGNLA